MYFSTGRFSKLLQSIPYSGYSIFIACIIFTAILCFHTTHLKPVSVHNQPTKSQTPYSPKPTQPDPQPEAPSPQPQQSPTPTAAPTAANGLVQQDDTAYHVVVNKKHPNTPLDYTPPDLAVVGSQRVRTAVADAIRQMQSDSGNSVFIIPASGYRSYDTQVSVYGGYVASYGQASADTFSARPGYSEHQTGLAIDFSPIDDSFANTPQFAWLQANAYKYGFVLRYPPDKDAITGYKYEPWHWRYVGNTVALDMHNRGIDTLEEYFQVVGGDY